MMEIVCFEGYAYIVLRTFVFCSDWVQVSIQGRSKWRQGELDFEQETR